MDFRHWAHKAADWSADYLDKVRSLPVRAQTKPGSIHAALPTSPPEVSEPMEAIFADLDSLILPGMTHWQHPGSSPTSPLIQARLPWWRNTSLRPWPAVMLWQTSQPRTELEARMIDWLRQMVGLPNSFTGVIGTPRRRQHSPRS